MTEKILSGTLLDDKQELSLAELAEICSCDVEWVIELVEEGVIAPQGSGPGEWQFNGITLLRVRTAIRLHRDLDLNLPGIALALELMDEIDELQSRLGVLEP